MNFFRMMKAIHGAGWILAIVIAGVTACSRPKMGSTTPAAPTAGIAGVPFEFTVPQRSTTPVNGTAGKLLVHTGDITGGKVSAGLELGGSPLTASSSLRVGQLVRFDFEGAHYALVLTHLSNALVGQDFATFTLEVATPGPAGMQQDEVIERLLGAVAGLQAAVLNRNGSDYPPVEAVEHLRMKRESEGEMTAEQFIDGIATKSSLSGRAYEIRHGDGSTEALADFLRAELKKIRGGAGD